MVSETKNQPRNNVCIVYVYQLSDTSIPFCKLTRVNSKDNF